MKFLRVFILFPVIFYTLSCSSSQTYSGDQVQNRSKTVLGACQAGLTGTDAEYKLMDTLGVALIRNSIPWSGVEKKPGIWDFSHYDKLIDKAVKHNKKVIVLLAYDVPWIYAKGGKSRNITKDKIPFYLEYVKKIAHRYGKQVYGFEVWNEPNTPMFWKGSDTDFFELTRETTILLKKICPDKPVAIGSIFYNPIMGSKSYLKKMIKYKLFENADAVSIHPYALSLSAAERRTAEVSHILKQAGYKKQLWVTEIGFTTGGWYPNKTTVQKQANAVIETIVRLSAAGADLIAWFKLLDGKMPEDTTKRTSSEEFFGLAYPDFTLKPSGKSFMLTADALKNALYIPKGITLINRTSNNLKTYRFQGSDDSVLLVVWSEGHDYSIRIESPLLSDITSTNLISGIKTIFQPSETISVSRQPLLLKSFIKGNDSLRLSIQP